MSFILAVGETHTLHQPLAAGDVLNLSSDTVNLTSFGHEGQDNTSINLFSSEGDVLLTISFRRPTQTVIYNSRPHEGEWGPEECSSFRGCFQNGRTNITVTVTTSYFDVVIDNTLRHTYPKRILRPTVRVSYWKNEHMPSTMFASDLGVSIRRPSPALLTKSYEATYFRYTAAQAAEESKNRPFDFVIIGSGIGGGVLASSLLEKHRMITSQSFSKVEPHVPDEVLPKPVRVLVVERGGLLFHTHSLNGPRPSSGSGLSQQANEAFYNEFKHHFDVAKQPPNPQEHYAGGPLYCLGGRSAVWGLFTPRISIDSLDNYWPAQVRNDLMDNYYPKAEKMMKIAFPETLPPHQALIDRLNLRTKATAHIPATQFSWVHLASEFREEGNFNFAEGAFSSIDTLLSAAMDNPDGQTNKSFRTILNTPVCRLEPEPQSDGVTSATHVVVRHGDEELKIACKQAIVCAGTVESAAILLRSVGGDTHKFGDGFVERFGHVTDHRSFGVVMPFFYRSMQDRKTIGGVKVLSPMKFNIIRDGKVVDCSVALAMVALDTVSFLPRDDLPGGDLPVGLVSWILPTPLSPQNNIQLNDKNEPRISIDWADDPYLEDKKVVMRDFAVDAMNKVVAVLGIRWAELKGEDYYPILRNIETADIVLRPTGPGVWAHEQGSIPMPNQHLEGGIVDEYLGMKYGWNNVSVCDLSVFPYSAAANPSLTLAALALRLSDKLVPDPKYRPVTVYNVCGRDVDVVVEVSKRPTPPFGPPKLTLRAGKNHTWKIAQNEAILIFSCQHATSYDLQVLTPGGKNLIVDRPPAPPVDTTCSCGVE